MQTQHTKFVECGTDEAGRGCLQSVTAAAVILPPPIHMLCLPIPKNWLPNNEPNCEKKSSRLPSPTALPTYPRKNRWNQYPQCIDRSHASRHSKLNPHQNIFLLMATALRPISISHTNAWSKRCPLSQYCSRIGTGKTERDDFMKKLHSKSPDYGWDTNKGYPTKKHRKVSSLLVCHNGIEKVLHYCQHKRNSTLTLLTLYHALFARLLCAFCLDAMLNPTADNGEPLGFIPAKPLQFFIPRIWNP